MKRQGSKREESAVNDFVLLLLSLVNTVCGYSTTDQSCQMYTSTAKTRFMTEPDTSRSRHHCQKLYHFSIQYIGKRLASNKNHVKANYERGE